MTVLDVDGLDLKILEMLREDGRIPFTGIGKRLKLSESTIRKRVRSLQEKGVIKNFSIEINQSKIGINTVAIVGVDVDPTHLLTAAQDLCEINEVRSVVTPTGDQMIMTEIWTRDGKELTKLISEKIGKIEGIKKICPTPCDPQRIVREEASPEMRYLSDEEYEKYWFELGGTREAIAQDLTKEVSALVLDVACGWGYYTFQLALNHPLGKIVAVDIIPSAFTNMRRELCGHQPYENIELLLADATRMPLKDAVFDLSTSFLGMRDIYMTSGREGVKGSIREMIRTLKKQGLIALAVTPPDLAETEELRIAVEVEGEVFGARSLPSTFYKDFFKENGIRLLSAKSYSTGQKMTSAQTNRELRDGIEIAREIYQKKVPNFEEIWERYGPGIEQYGYGMYSKITVFGGRKD